MPSNSEHDSNLDPAFTGEAVSFGAGKPRWKCIRCGNYVIEGERCLKCETEAENVLKALEVQKQGRGIRPETSVWDGVRLSVEQAENNAKAHETPLTAKEFTGNKYYRKIVGLEGNTTTVDVYRVLTAFAVTEPGLQHAIKKLLCAGIRGKNDTDNDLKEAIDAITATRISLGQTKK